MSSILDTHNLQIFDNAAFDEKPQRHHDPVKENRSPPSTFPNSNRPVSIDEEISVVEREISQLSKKLEALKIKKAQADYSNKTPSAAKNRGRIVPAKFLNLETPPRTATRRGFSLGPSDIYQNATPFRARKPLKGIQEEEVGGKDLGTTTRRRGMSIGPSDIYQTATPFRAQKTLTGIKGEKGRDLTTAQRRGMSLGPSEILKEAKVGQQAKKKGGLSASPKPQKPVNLKVLELNGVSTVGMKKSVKMVDGSLSVIIKPKTLFEEPTKSLNAKVSELRNGVSTVGPKKMVRMDEGSISGVKPKALLFEGKKRPSKNAKVRIVASRYSIASNSNYEVASKRRKWSLPDENEKYERKNDGATKKRCFSLGGENVSQLKQEGSPPSSIMKIAEALPKIRTLRCVIDSPRDSGCAKRVADLVGKKPCFGEFTLSSSCQSLKFEDGEDLTLSSLKW